jgi:hypothetical protein
MGTGEQLAVAGFSIVGSDLFVANQKFNDIVQIDTLTGNRTVVSSSSVGSGPPINTPVDLEISPSGSLLVTTAPLTDTILSIDPLTGDRTIVTSDSVGTGPTIGPFPGELGVASNGTLFISTNAFNTGEHRPDNR